MAVETEQKLIKMAQEAGLNDSHAKIFARDNLLTEQIGLKKALEVEGKEQASELSEKC